MFNLFNLIVLIGTIHGFIVGVLLLFGFKSNKSKIYLSLVLLGFSAILLRITLIDIDKQSFLPSLIVNFILLIAPALYLYVMSQANKSISFKFITISFSPFIILNFVFLLSYFTYGKSEEYQIALAKALKFNDVISLLYYGAYLLISYNYFRLNKALFKISQQKWIKILLFTQISFLGIWLIYVLIELAIFNYSLLVSDYYPMMIMISIILYYISFHVYNNRSILFQSTSLPKRKNFILNKKESQNLLNRVNSIMFEDKLFLDGDLTLKKLAINLKTNPKTLSFVINELCKKNFNDYINEWRIDEVKKRLKDNSFDNLKMLSIAFDCGFNSKSTFNLAFKKATGLSPSEFRKGN